MPDDQLRALAANLMVQSQLRSFVNPVKRYLSGIPGRYRNYRKFQREPGIWYKAGEAVQPAEVHPLEVDIVLLAMLKSTGELLSRSEVLRSLHVAVWESLNATLDLYRAQILVDEATDFSPIQLASMLSLAHPRTKSFFACGDFNQRLTSWGTRTSEQMRWVSPQLGMREVSIVYRQSRQLNDLSSALVDLVGGTKPNATLPPDVDSDGVSPALIENADQDAAVEWLASRIVEIEALVRQLPSIAIFVRTEADVQPFATALNAALEPQNVRVVACPNGQVVGQENEVRVFDIQHIKGLEFEAVFFVDLDRLEQDKEQLFPSYLYVGSTRAATYLGVTCRGSLPRELKTLASSFVAQWNH